MIEGTLLGLPLIEWALMPFLGLAFGLLFYGNGDLREVFKAWLAATAFFLSRFLLESNEQGAQNRPDRLAGVLLMWAIYSLAMAGGAVVAAKRTSH